MKKTAGVFGNYRFMDIAYDNGRILPIYNYVINKLKAEYDVYNFANINANLDSIFKSLKVMTKIFDLDEIYLSLGEAESELNPDNLVLLSKEIEEKIENIFEYININKLHANIELLPETSESVALINKLIIKCADLYKLNIINKNVNIEIIGNKKVILSSLYI